MGQSAETQETFRRHLQLFEDYAEPRPDNSAAQRQLAVAYDTLADVERARANDESQTNRQRRDHWREAQAWLRKCHAVFIDMQDREILAVGDSGVPDMIAGEIDSCDIQLASLEQADP